MQDALAKEFGLSVNDISTTFVGPTWGSQISSKAIEALIAFLVVIVMYLSIAFDWKMASAAFVALMHDILITVGIYALAGFEVSPATVIGLLTILGYSLYDTVVVFDKVRENTAGLVTSARSTYSQAANLALNQTLVRSINTSLIALLPVAAILIAGTVLLGTGELSDLALVLFVGMLSGTYSSIFIATPVLADLKEREPQYKALAKRLQARAASPRVAAKQAGAGAQAPVPAGPAVAGGRAAADISADDQPADSGRTMRPPATTTRRNRRTPPDAGAPPRSAVGAGGAAAGRRARRAPASSHAVPPRPNGAPATPRRRGGRRCSQQRPPGRRVSPAESPADVARRARQPDQEAHPRRARLPATGHLVQGHHAAARRRARVRRGRGRTRRRRSGPVDKVAGIEARGFILAAPVAARLVAGFVPVRKAGKLPSAAAPAGLPARIRHGHDRGAHRRLRPGRPGAHRGRRAGHRRDRAGHRRSRAPLRCGVIGVAVLLELSFLNGRSRLGDIDFRALLTV